MIKSRLTALSLVIAIFVCTHVSMATIVTVHGEGYLYLAQPTPNSISLPDETTTVMNINRVFWSSTKAALRFGIITEDSIYYRWSEANLGYSSFAAGENARAVGSHSFAFGFYATALASNSIAIGPESFAHSYQDIALGGSVTYNSGVKFGAIAIGGSDSGSGYTPVAIGSSSAYGDFAVALGGAGADGNFAFSVNGWAEGTNAVSILGSATGDNSIAIGKYSAALDNATAIGQTTSTSQFGLAVGRFNLNKQKNGTSFPSGGSDDPIFEVGNGTSSTSTSNAFSVYRDGWAKVTGQLNVGAGVVAQSFTGAGSGITALNASNISTGTISDARLGANIPRLTANNAFAGQITATGNMGVGTVTPSARLAIVGSGTGTASALSVAGSDNVERFRVQDNGNMTVTGGTLTFAAATGANVLVMNNNSISNANHLSIADPGANEGISWSGTSGNWMIDVSPLNRSNADGNLNFYNSAANNVAFWRPTLWVATEADYASASMTAGGLNLTTTGTANITLNPAGNVGVGTVAPEAKLHVVGATKMDGDVEVTGSITLQQALGGISMGQFQ